MTETSPLSSPVLDARRAALEGRDERALSQESMPKRLTDGEIETLVTRYREAMPRYEDAAALVEARLRRELRAAALKSLLSSRAKHPDEVRNKLKRLRDREDERATFSNLSANLNHVLTDLAGARVVVYHPAKEETAFELVRRKFAVASLPNAIEVKNKDYRASHALLELDATFERSSIRGTIVEVQVTSVASHVFNELEHDIRYKTHGVEPTAEVLACVDDLQHASRLLDRVVERLLDTRSSSREDAETVLEEPEELRHALERVLGRPMSGDFTRLHRLLGSVLTRLTLVSLQKLGDVGQLIERGKTSYHSDDDVVGYVVSLLGEFGGEFRAMAKSWRGPTTELKRAILGDTEPT